eukprot:6203647-Pleurochrysis_carterae.AAC.1
MRRFIYRSTHCAASHPHSPQPPSLPGSHLCPLLTPFTVRHLLSSILRCALLLRAILYSCRPQSSLTASLVMPNHLFAPSPALRFSVRANNPFAPKVVPVRAKFVTLKVTTDKSAVYSVAFNPRSSELLTTADGQGVVKARAPRPALIARFSSFTAHV